VPAVRDVAGRSDAGSAAPVTAAEQAPTNAAREKLGEDAAQTTLIGGISDPAFVVTLATPQHTKTQ
jgi:hypothetical protein